MSIKEKLANVYDKVGEFHNKDNRRKISQKLTKAAGLEKVMQKAKNKSDSIAVKGEPLAASKMKLADRAQLKLTNLEHKSLHSSDETQWPKSMDGKSLEQIGKYFGRALQDKDIATSMALIHKHGGDAVEHLTLKVAEAQTEKRIDKFGAVSAV